MPEPTIDTPDERGIRWLQEQVLALLARDPHAPQAGAVTCTWGTRPETCTTLYLCLDGAAEPYSLHFTWGMIADCGAGHRARQNQAITTIRRRLQKLGLLTP